MLAEGLNNNLSKLVPLAQLHYEDHDLQFGGLEVIVVVMICMHDFV